MRITSISIFNQLTRSLHNNLRVLSKLSNRLATGKNISSPSEDITVMGRSMDYKVTLNELNQLRKNIDEADALLSYTDSVMSVMATTLTRSKELAIQGSTDTLTDVDRAALAREILVMRDEVVSLSNSKYRNRYLFSGFKTNINAFDASFNYQGDSGEIHVLIDRGSTMSVNIPGDSVFGDGATSIMGMLDQFYNDLISGNKAGIQGAVDSIDNALDTIADVRAEMGAKLRNLDEQRLNLDNRGFNIQTLLSNVEDADIADTVSEISKTEVALQSLRAAGAEVFSKSLLDFLR
ncbi:MAG: flagellar hook-associated protein FlgL [Nitrospiraceae bacterium]|nr:MAG: flagellar hook-associated protein FlgL [Nitrospiraceae bacterium]